LRKTTALFIKEILMGENKKWYSLAKWKENGSVNDLEKEAIS
jgi:hypothetical protein